jgi:hypothetical protein
MLHRLTARYCGSFAADPFHYDTDDVESKPSERVRGAPVRDPDDAERLVALNGGTSAIVHRGMRKGVE